MVGMSWYVLVIILVVILSISGLILVSVRFDPYKATNPVRFLFFGPLFIALWGLSTLALNRFKLKIDWPDFYKSFKIGFVISLVVYLGIFVIRYGRY